MKNFEEVEQVVRETLSEARYNHSKYVMERCIEFAKIWGEDVEKARLIGIAHDIAKEIPRNERIERAEKDGVILDEIEKEALSLIHAKHGAVICKKKFGFSDDMCRAISMHTTAGKNMTKLDKILYLADFSEKSRGFKEAEEAYELGKKDLEKGYFLALVGKIKFMLDDGTKIHQNSINAYNEFVSKTKGKYGG